VITLTREEPGSKNFLCPVNILATTLPDAWFQLVESCFTYGRDYTIAEGSYAGSKRKELDWVQIHITHPHTPPLLPDMPPGLESINPVPGGMEYIEEYLPYLMTDMTPKEGEAYTYGQRLLGANNPPSNFWDRERSKEEMAKLARQYLKEGAIRLNSQVEEVIEKYKRGFGNNQCAMTIAIPSDVHLLDPPCLRHIDTRVFTDGQRDGPPKLHFFLYTRSWDIWCGFPANMAALVHLQQYMATCIEIEAGEIIATSKGAHLYDMYWDIVKRRLGRHSEKD
jgi:thymidylate synthase